MSVIGREPASKAITSADIVDGAFTLNDLNFTDVPANLDITGTIDKNTMRLAEGVTVIGDVTISDDLVLAKLSDDGDPITMTTDGTTRTITGSGSIESTTIAQTHSPSLTGMTGSLSSGTTIASGVTFPSGMPIQVVSFNTSAQAGFDLPASDTDTDPDIFKLITPKGSGSSFLISIRWAGEIDIPQDCVFNIQRVVSGASTVRINAPGTAVYQGLSGAYGGSHGSDDDSTPNSCTFSTLDTTGSTAGTDITYRLVVCASGSSTTNTFYTNRTVGSAGATNHEAFSSEMIITEIAG